MFQNILCLSLKFCHLELNLEGTLKENEIRCRDSVDGPDLQTVGMMWQVA